MDAIEELEEQFVQGEVVVDEPDVASETADGTEYGTITVPLNLVRIISSAPSGQRILQTCLDLAVFLSSKNISYGDSALNPTRLFSKANATEQLLVRIDDKINRLVKGGEYPGDDDILDLTGYLILYFASKENDGNNSEGQ